MSVLDPNNTFYNPLTLIHPFDPLVEFHDKLKAKLEEMKAALNPKKMMWRVLRNLTLRN